MVVFIKYLCSTYACFFIFFCRWWSNERATSHHQIFRVVVGDRWGGKMPFPSFLSSRAPSFSLATVLVEKIGKHKCHHHRNLFWPFVPEEKLATWHFPCSSLWITRKREWYHDMFLRIFSGLQTQDSGSFQMFISMHRKLLGYSVWIMGEDMGRSYWPEFSDQAFEAAIFP